MSEPEKLPEDPPVNKDDKTGETITIADQKKDNVDKIDMDKGLQKMEFSLVPVNPTHQEAVKTLDVIPSVVLPMSSSLTSMEQSSTVIIPGPEIASTSSLSLPPQQQASTSSLSTINQAVIIGNNPHTNKKQKSKLKLGKLKKGPKKNSSSTTTNKDSSFNSPLLSNKPLKSKSKNNKKAKKNPQKRGRKTKEWYMANDKEPGFSKLNKKRKKFWDDYDQPTFVNTSKGASGGMNAASTAIMTTPLGGGFTASHMTTKEILDSIFLDHNYCTVLYSANRSKVQPFRHLFGPKDEYKAQFFPESLISPNKFLPPVTLQSPSFSHVVTQSPPPPPPLLNLPPPSSPPVKSKLEFLLKGGAAAAAAASNSSSPRPATPTTTTAAASTLTPVPKRSSTPSKKYWEVHDETEEEVDVEGLGGPSPGEVIPYDVAKAKNLMLQCDKHSKIIKATDGDDDWEEQIVRTGWTITQRKLFDNVLKSLHAERLARLAYDKHPAEPVLRRASLDKTTARVRSALSLVQWNTKLTQWLHGVLIDGLNQTYLAIYLDVLQTLKAFAPHLVDKMIVLSYKTAPIPMEEDLFSPDLISPSGTNNINNVVNTDSGNEVVLSDNKSSNNNLEDSKSKKEAIAKNAAALQEVLTKKANNLCADALTLLLKKPWDPFSPVVHHTKLKKLGCNPVFLYIPCVSPISAPNTAKRYKNFLAMLGVMGKVITISLHSSARSCSVSKYAEKLTALTKAKISENRKLYPDKPIFLIGWGSGSIIAATAAVSHPIVEGVIALGFPLFGLAGPRGTLEDQILELKKPILFIIGGRSPDVNVTDMELLRKQLSCESSMVVIGSGDRTLRVPRYHRLRLLITQSWVDKCILDEMAYFINLHSKHVSISAAVSAERSFLSNNKPHLTNKMSTSSVKQRQNSEKENNSAVRKRMTSTGSTASSSYHYQHHQQDVKGLLGKPFIVGGDQPSPFLPFGGGIDGLDDSGMSNDSYYSRETGSPTKGIEGKGKKRKGSGKDSEGNNNKITKKLKVEKQRRPSGGNTAGDDSNRKSLLKLSDDPSEYVSPVLSYLGATPGPGGLLHNLLSPPLPTTASSPCGTSPEKKKQRLTKPKYPKQPQQQLSSLSSSSSPPSTPQPTSASILQLTAGCLPLPSMHHHHHQHNPRGISSISTPPTVLAGGATATPVPGPVIPAFSSVDSMRQYVIQHQAVMQRHLLHMQGGGGNTSTNPHQIGTPAAAAAASPQLLRLLSPSGNNNNHGHGGSVFHSSHSAPSSAPYAAPTFHHHETPTTEPQNTKIDAGNVGLPSDLNVTLIQGGLGESQQQMSNELKTTKMSKQQLVSNMTTPIVRIPSVIMGGEGSHQHHHHHHHSNLQNYQQNLSNQQQQQQQQNFLRTTTISQSMGSSSSTTTNYSGSMGTSVVHQFQPRPHSIPMPVLGEGAQANVVFKTADKTIATTLSTEDVKSLFAGGVLRCNVPGESMPVNIVLKSQMPVVSTNLGHHQHHQHSGGQQGFQFQSSQQQQQQQQIQNPQHQIQMGSLVRPSSGGGGIIVSTGGGGQMLIQSSQTTCSSSSSSSTPQQQPQVLISSGGGGNPQTQVQPHHYPSFVNTCSNPPGTISITVAQPRPQMLQQQIPVPQTFPVITGVKSLAPPAPLPVNALEQQEKKNTTKSLVIDSSTTTTVAAASAQSSDKSPLIIITSNSSKGAADGQKPPPPTVAVFARKSSVTALPQQSMPEVKVVSGGGVGGQDIVVVTSGKEEEKKTEEEPADSGSSSTPLKKKAKLIDQETGLQISTPNKKKAILGTGSVSLLKKDNPATTSSSDGKPKPKTYSTKNKKSTSTATATTVQQQKPAPTSSLPSSATLPSGGSVTCVMPKKTSTTAKVSADEKEKDLKDTVEEEDEIPAPPETRNRKRSNSKSESSNQPTTFPSTKAQISTSMSSVAAAVTGMSSNQKGEAKSDLKTPKKNKNKVVGAVRKARTISSSSEEEGGGGSSATKTKGKKNKGRKSRESSGKDSSGGNESNDDDDEPAAPRLTRSMRRQSSINN